MFIALTKYTRFPCFNNADIFLVSCYTALHCNQTMPCKKSEFVAAINSFGTARSTNDQTLVQLAVNLLSQLIETLEFAPEDQPTEEVEETPQPKTTKKVG